LIAGSQLASLEAADAAKASATGSATLIAAQSQTERLNPFTHVALIPNGADLRSIRFEKLTAVNVPVAIADTTDSDYCRQAQFRDPGGSMACPSFRTVESAPAFEATYSYTGPAMASDEYSGRRFTFSVTFRANELPMFGHSPHAGTSTRSRAADYFVISTSHERVRRVVINSEQSQFCDGDYVDGQWTRTDPGCQDKIIYTVAAMPSGFVTVRVDPTTPAR
jgi:hypothetical protein